MSYNAETAMDRFKSLGQEYGGFISHADVEYMRFAGGNREHAIGNDFGGTLQHPAFITGRKAIAKDGVSPGTPTI